MPSPSPVCTVNSGSTPADVTAGATCTIALASTAAANFWFIQAVSTDETNTAAAINATIVVDSVHKTATFTAPASTGSAVIFQSTVGIGPSSALGSGRDVNNVIVPAFTTTFKVNVKTGAGLRVLSANELTEQGASGWVAPVNAVIRANATGSVSVTGSGLLHATGGTLDASAYHGTAGQGLFTTAAGTDTAWATISGDVSASTSTPGALTVTGLRGQSLPAPSGSNTFLQWSGAALSWAAAGGGGFTSISGVDVAAADSSHAYVQSISGASGAGGTVPLNITALQFAAGQTAASLSHAAATGDVTPANLTLSPQGPFAGATTTGHQTPGSVVLNFAAPVTGGNHAALVLQDSGNTFCQIGYGSIESPVGGGVNLNSSAIWLFAPGDGPASPTNYVLKSNSSATTLTAAYANGAASVVSRGTGVATIESSGTGHITFSMGVTGTVQSIAYVTGPGATAGVSQFGVYIAAPIATPAFGHLAAVSDAVAQALTVQAQSAFASAVTNVNGGTLLIQGGAAKINGTTGLRGGVRAQIGRDVAETLFEVGEVAIGRRYTALNQLGSGLTTTQLPANTGDGVTLVCNAQTDPTAPPGVGFILYAKQSTGDPWIYTSAGVNFQLSSGGGGSFTAGGDLTGSSTTQYIQTIGGSNNTGTTVTVRSGVSLSYSTNTTLIKSGGTALLSTDGNLDTIYNATGAAGSAFHMFEVGGTTYGQLGSLTLGSTNGGLWLAPSVSASNTNYTLATSSVSTIVNAPSGGGGVALAVAGTLQVVVSSGQVNNLSGAQTVLGWQGAANTQTDQMLWIPVNLRTTVHALTTFYSFSLANHQSATVTFIACGRTVIAGGGPWDVVDACNSAQYRADLYNASGTAVVNSAGYIYNSVSPGIVGVNVTGSTVQLQCGAEPTSGGANPTVDWQCWVLVVLN